MGSPEVAHMGPQQGSRALLGVITGLAGAPVLAAAFVLPASGRSVPVLWNATPELRLTVMPFAPLPEMSFAATSACEPRSTRMPVPVFDGLSSLSGHQPIERYGSTETLITLSTLATGERRPGWVGSRRPATPTSRRRLT